MTVKFKKWDASEALDNEEVITEYLKLAFEDGNPEYIKSALANVAKSRNMTSIAKQMGISRQGLYNMLSENGNPEFKTIQSMLEVLGVKLSIVTNDKAKLKKVT
ncbi:MAG: putative addiction module antidote protein [Spirochaetes bacterium]|nr:putative addiction module antidote protein [Spirochaetota bacterium]